MSGEPQGILIEWDGNLYILWCMKCVDVTIAMKSDMELRCKKCGHLIGKRISHEQAAEMNTTATCH
jgi:DNA-directed RNA polymerase subunit RPC12/RpoP